MVDEVNAEEEQALRIAAAIAAGHQAQAKAAAKAAANGGQVNHHLPFHKLRHFLRVRKAKLLFLIMATKFVWAVRRGQVNEVWAGDSNSQLIPDDKMGAPLRHVADGRWACHLGPRLQYSIAKKGLAPGFMKILAKVGRLKGARDIVWIYSFGEIDVRCGMVPRMDEPGAFDFTHDYFARMREVARVSGVDRLVIYAPSPESDIALEQIGFPVVGTIAERVECMSRLHAAMHRAAEALSADAPRILLLDTLPQMVDERGVWLREYTYDGLHTNNAGRALVRGALAELVAADEAAHPRR
ncbi:hypothetical protein [Nocardioides jejuensis]|uniref:SGNH/GDSL hydrolase family protein n=1 Tax=Nocardioides jejuensis TaxID=2502782 RepID=A0A4R1BVV3_9ACTN|nr:hypothetical protein [Nocardioides jejuensis]TCJ21921.1 hypothetical protein EPD65_14145 [Nocardioides jejuensis]